MLRSWVRVVVACKKSIKSQVAFNAEARRDSGSRQSGSSRQTSHSSSQNSGNRGNSSDGRGPGFVRRPPRCQLCRGEHYANQCPLFLNRAAPQPAPSRAPQSMPHADLAQAFQAQCSFTPQPSNGASHADWFVDSGASAHIAAQPNSLDSVAPYSGNQSVVVGNAPTQQGNTSSGPL